jgi:hypothetical protein
LDSLKLARIRPDCTHTLGSWKTDYVQSASGCRPRIALKSLVAGDDGIYFTQAAAGPGGSPAVEWSSQALVEGIGSSHRPAIVLFHGTPFMAWKGVGNDHTIYTKRQL